MMRVCKMLQETTRLHLRPFGWQRQRLALLQRQARKAGRELWPQRYPPPTLILIHHMNAHWTLCHGMHVANQIKQSHVRFWQCSERHDRAHTSTELMTN